MTFQEYRESGLFLEDVNIFAVQRVNQYTLRQHSLSPFYVNLRGFPKERKTLFSITCYYTSLLLQSVGKVYGGKYTDYFCKAFRWPFFCTGNRDEVSPIEILKSANMLPQGDEVDEYVQKLDEAKEYFVEDFLALFKPDAKFQDSFSYRELVRVVDFPVLRKELDNEIGFFRNWVYHQNLDYGKYYVDPGFFGQSSCRKKPFRVLPEFDVPKASRILAIRSHVTLHSDHFQKQLKNLYMTVMDFGSYSMESFTKNPARDMFKRFLEGKRISVDTNIVVFKVPRDLFQNDAETAQMLKDAVINGEYGFRADRCSLDGRYDLSVKPDSVRVEFFRGEGENLYDVAVAYFGTELQILNPVPLIPLNQLEMPFRYGGSSRNSCVMALRAMLEYGKQVRKVPVPEFKYFQQIVKVPDSAEALEKIFFHEMFCDKDLTPIRMMRLLSDVGMMKLPENLKSQTGGIHLCMSGHHRVWDKIIRDVDNMIRVAHKGIDALKSATNKEKTFRMELNPKHGSLSFDIGGDAWSRVSTIEFLERDIAALHELRGIILYDLIPLEREMSVKVAVDGGKHPYGKRERSKIARTLCHYMCQKIQADPLAFVDSKHDTIQEYAKMLVSG